MVDLGADIHSDWSFNDNGDLNLVKDNANLAQSITNRLNCYQPNMDVYYDEYGGFLHSYLGRRRTQETLDLMKIELDTILQQDTRISNFNSSLEFNQAGNVLIDLSVTVNDEDVELNLILGSDGVVVEDAD